MKEYEIRPRELFECYLSLCQKDAQRFDAKTFEWVHCPGCGSDMSKKQFTKNGFQYVFCLVCGTLYCSPRPREEDLKAFYQHSESARYWSKVFYPAVADIRRKKIFSKKARQVYEVFKSKEGNIDSICDVGAGYGAFLEELAGFFPNAELFAVEPNNDLADHCKAKGYQTLQTTAENAVKWKERFDLVLSSEVIEHVYSCDKFATSLYQLVKMNGYCLVTGLGYEGYDILTLQEHSNSVFPPHHLNFLSIKGFKSLFERAGFSHIDIWTPGVLDVDIVKNSPAINEFTRVLSSRGEGAVKEFQSFLQKYLMSSHVWVTAQK